MNRELRTGLPALTGVLALSAGHVAVTLATASGVTQVGPTSYHTEFGNPEWWIAGFLLAFPVALASRFHPRLTAGFVIAALVPQFALPQLVIQRAIAAGWGDPMLGMGYLYPLLMTPFIAFPGYLAGRRRRPSRPAT